MGNLQGRRSCHGHMYSPAGWVLPHRHALSVGHNSSCPCDPNQGSGGYKRVEMLLVLIFSCELT